jgi:hypothetical protein
MTEDYRRNQNVGIIAGILVRRCINEVLEEERVVGGDRGGDVVVQAVVDLQTMSMIKTISAGQNRQHKSQMEAVLCTSVLTNGREGCMWRSASMRPSSRMA